MAKGFRTLLAYQKAFALAMRVFELSKAFPSDEKYSLTDQVRRSSRSVCANIGEAYRRRQYSKHFQSKLADSDSENTESQVWFDFARKCDYINEETYNELCESSEEVGRLVNYMINHPEKFS